MYTLVYQRKETEGGNVFQSEYTNEVFKLKRNALHYLRGILQNEYKEMGYATEVIPGGLCCYRSYKNINGERKTIEERIKVEKY